MVLSLVDVEAFKRYAQNVGAQQHASDNAHDNGSAAILDVATANA